MTRFETILLVLLAIALAFVFGYQDGKRADPPIQIQVMKR
jgi:glucose-6-phosphate-specific signal transduction histidine kinase